MQNDAPTLTLLTITLTQILTRTLNHNRFPIGVCGI